MSIDEHSVRVSIAQDILRFGYGFDEKMADRMYRWVMNIPAPSAAPTEESNESPARVLSQHEVDSAVSKIMRGEQTGDDNG